MQTRPLGDRSAKFDLTNPSTNGGGRNNQQSIAGLSAIEARESMNLSPSEGLSPDVSTRKKVPSRARGSGSRFSL
jgi:hypothetical protein